MQHVPCPEREHPVTAASLLSELIAVIAARNSVETEKLRRRLDGHLRQPAAEPSSIAACSV